MAAIDAINNNNIFAMYGTQGVNPFVQGTQETPKVGQVEQPKKTGQTQGTGLQSELASIRENGMRVNDSTFGVNEPFATTPQTQLGKSGTVGANYRFLA